MYTPLTITQIEIKNIPIIPEVPFCAFLVMTPRGQGDIPLCFLLEAE